MVRVADTSALYAFFHRDDPHTEAAIAGIEDPTPLLLPREILVETAGLLQLRHGVQLAREATNYLLNHPPHVHLADPVDLGAAHRIFQDADTNLSLADAIVVQTCRVHGADPFCFDADIEAAV